MPISKKLFLTLILLLGISGCGLENSPSVKPEEISNYEEISSMSFTDERLDTSTEWVNYFDSHQYYRYNEDETLISGVNDFEINAGWITPVFMDPAPQTGQYSKSVDVTICSDGAYSRSTGRGTCSWHGGIGGFATFSLHVDVVQIWLCEDAATEGYVLDLSEANGHAFLNKDDCSPYGGGKSIHTYGKTYKVQKQ